ncbi:protein FAM161B [Anabrus simplex]|uniref:protein FAM161B n=1 Tax=Anabrus simplex TaxID=316456 RepID=UPI0035A38496
MSTKHIGAVFNHSCLKVPVNPSNRLPSPSYERKCMSSLSEEGKTNRERTRKSASLSGSRKSSWSSTRKQVSKKDSPRDGEISSHRSIVDEYIFKESVESFINFYESIPDYGDLTHLSDREFYLKLQQLKEKQKSYLEVLDKSTYNTLNEVELPTDDGNIKKTEEHKAPYVVIEKPEKIPTGTTGSSRKYDEALQSSDTKQKHTLDVQNSNLFWEKYEDKNEVAMCTPETASVASLDNIPANMMTKYNLDSHRRVACISVTPDSEVPNNKTDMNLNEYSKTDTSDVTASLPEFNKMKMKKQKNGTNKVRDIHSASSNKQPSCATLDSSSSVLESMWDGFSVDECVPKSEYCLSDSDCDLEENAPYSYSLPNSPIMKHNKNVAWKEPKITLPKPFKMTLREEEDREMNALKCQLYDPVIEDECREKKMFRANPVPLKTKLPLYDKIMAEQEKRRRKIKGQCIAELKSQMKPFSFVKRDEERRRLKLCCSTPELRDSNIPPKPFKARPVPKNLFSTFVYQKMREDEYYRNLRKKIRAEELLKSSSLPPSMAAREEVAKSTNVPVELSEDSGSGSDRPKKKRHKIPNYKKSHELMRRELEARWNENITTSPEPFHLKTERRGRKSAKYVPMSGSSSPSPYEGNSAYYYERLRPRSALSITPNRNNLAAILRIQSTRQRIEREMEEMQDEMEKKERAKLKEQLTRRKPAWRALNYSTAEDLALRVQSRREEERLRQEEFEHCMELMLGRVQRIPTLFERQSQAKKFMMKNLQKSVTSHRLSDGNISRQNSPDLYPDRDSENHASEDKTSKMGLKVSIKETAETIECSSDEEHGSGSVSSQVEGETKTLSEDSKQQDGDEYTESIPEETETEKGSEEIETEKGSGEIETEKGSEEDNSENPAENNCNEHFEIPDS